MVPEPYQKPSSVWPTGGFALLRVFQFLCSTVVVGVLGYFVFHLVKDGYSIPWEFVILDVVSAFTFLNILVSLVLLCWGRLPPRAVLATDGILLVFWVVAFALLARAMGQTITQSCSADNWGTDGGINICRMYKALFAFSCLAWIAHLITFITANVVHRRVPDHVYIPTPNPSNRMQDTAYSPHNSYVAPPMHNTPYGHEMQPNEPHKTLDYYNHPMQHNEPHKTPDYYNHPMQHNEPHRTPEYHNHGMQPNESHKNPEYYH
ncbi:hypothetical protein RUND412_003495 [Rhizina undulata]